MKPALVGWQILRQNRWLWLLMTLWPLGMALLLTRGGSSMSPGDVETWVHQECLYGWTVVAFAAGTTIGNEERSRRIALVLARALSRREYLGAIWLAAAAALLLYSGSVAASGTVLHAPWSLIARSVLAEVAIGLILCSTSLLLSLLLPGVIASGLGLGFIGGLAYLADRTGQSWALARLLRLVTTGAVDGGWLAGLGQAAALAAVVFAGAVLVFERQDISLKSE